MVESAFAETPPSRRIETPPMRSTPRQTAPSKTQAPIKQLVKFSASLAQPRLGVRFSPSSPVSVPTTRQILQDSKAAQTLAMQDLFKMTQPTHQTKPSTPSIVRHTSMNTNTWMPLPIGHTKMDEPPMAVTFPHHAATSSVKRLPLTLQPHSLEEQAPTGSKVHVDHTIPPVYPRIALEQGWEGTVFLRIAIQPDGTPKNLTVRKSSGYDILDNAAIHAVSSWHFVAARDGNVPIQSIVEVPIRFHLQKPQK